jgi:hypothetical protein
MEDLLFHGLDVSFSQTPICVKNNNVDWDRSISLLRGEYESFVFPLHMEYVSGQKWTDILNPTNAFRIVSDRFVTILKEKGFTGWKTFSVTITDKSGNQVEGYSGFSITGRCGKPDYEKSERIEKRFVPQGQLVTMLKGRHLDLRSWDGTDFFLPEGTVAIEVTDRVRRALEPLKFTNLVFSSHADWEMNEASIPKR